VFFSTAVASRSTFESVVTRAFADGDNDRIAVAQTAACYPPRRLRLRHLSARRGSGDATSLTEERSRGAKRDSLSMIVDETNVARLDRSDGPAIDAAAPRECSIVAALKDTRVRTVNLSVNGDMTTDSSGIVRGRLWMQPERDSQCAGQDSTDAFRSMIFVPRKQLGIAHSPAKSGFKAAGNGGFHRPWAARKLH
jgi:hypothetical protein